jgi:hypothetical protein
MKCRDCNKIGVSNCDGCDLRTCKNCSQIVVLNSTDTNVSLFHRKKCVPKKFRKEVKE